MARAITGTQLEQSFKIVERAFATNEFSHADTARVLEALEVVRDVCGELAAMLRQMPDA